MSEPRVSVIVPLWNGAACIRDCVAALMAQTIADQLEILVVDDASSDEGATLVEREFPQVRLIRRAANGGFAAACNTGLQAARGDVLVLLNQDVVLADDALQVLVDALRLPERGAVGGKLRYPDGRVQHAGGYLLWPQGFGMHYGVGAPDDGQFDTPQAVEFVTGALLAVRREVFQEVGGLDEGFYPAYYEDVDWCFRIRAAGYTIWYEPRAVGVHQESGALRDMPTREVAYHRGRWRFLLKHLPPQRLLAEVIPAEAADTLLRQNQTTPYALQQALLAAMVQAPMLLRTCWQADTSRIADVVRALHTLIEQTWQREQVEYAPAITVEPLLLTMPRPQWSASWWKRMRQRLRWALYTYLARPEHEQMIDQQNAINKAVQNAVQNALAQMQAQTQSELAVLRQALLWLANDVAHANVGEEDSDV